VISLNQVSLAYGMHPLLDRVDLQIQTGERVCVIGRNGAGKSTLLRVISGTVAPDDGEVWRRDTLRVSHLEQDVPDDTGDTVYQAVARGLGEIGDLLAAYHRAAQQGTAEALRSLAALQQRIEAQDGWNVDHRIGTILTRLSLSPDATLAQCSGGERRQVMLARALVGDPDLLLLDEPTNHLDIEAINWLEQYLLAFRGALIFITHDRALVRRLATRIIELDRGRLTSFPGNYDQYLQRKEQLIEMEDRAAATFDRKLAEEEAWIRRGIKARRTRNEGRVRKLLAMRRERARRIERAGNARLQVDAGDLSGRRVVDLRGVSFRYGERTVIRDLSTTIVRGDRIGIIGPNGSGKSTLLRLILGDILPTAGEIVRGSRLQVAYFDQYREALDPAKTVRENVNGGGDYVTVQGRSRHVVGYLKDFLFPPTRIDSPVGILSGGERNRLLLARIFTRPSNLMVLDEPTNDLDVETLELLEDLLTDYEGTLILVSHDRTFIDNIVTSTLVFEGNGVVREHVGGYEDWLRGRSMESDSTGRSGPSTPTPRRSEAEAGRMDEYRGAAPERPVESDTIDSPIDPKRRHAAAPRIRKLSYREQRELDSLPAHIESLESEQSMLEAAMNQGDFYRRPKEAITKTLTRFEEIRLEIERAYERWEALSRRT
jgi:ATP-binding cassette subfamily F protein uup